MLRWPFGVLFALFAYFTRQYLSGDLAAGLVEMLENQAVKAGGFKVYEINVTSGPLDSLFYMDNMISLPENITLINNKGLPPLVLVHAFTMKAASMAMSFQPVIANRDRRVIIVELLGHGHNMLPNHTLPSLDEMLEGVVMTIDTVLPRDCHFHVLGFSLGGALSLFLLDRMPNRIKKTVLIAPTPFELVNREFTSSLYAKRALGWHNKTKIKEYFLEALGVSPNSLPPDFMMRGIQRIREKEKVPLDYWDEFFKIILVDSTKEDKKFENFLKHNSRDLGRNLKSNNAEIVIFVGERDALSKASKCIDFKLRMGDRCSLYVIPNTAHFGVAKNAGIVHSMVTEIMPMVSLILNQDPQTDSPERESFLTPLGLLVTRYKQMM
ncbi:hypothetical protein AAMO2058_001160000 [Amorphochlora amoebiformis]